MGKSKRIPEFEASLVKFGDKIKALRKKAAKSQQDIAFAIEMDKPNFRKIEKGRANVTFKTIHKLAKALDVSMSALLDFD